MRMIVQGRFMQALYQVLQKRKSNTSLTDPVAPTHMTALVKSCLKQDKCIILLSTNDGTEIRTGKGHEKLKLPLYYKLQEIFG